MVYFIFVESTCKRGANITCDVEEWILDIKANTWLLDTMGFLTSCRASPNSFTCEDFITEEAKGI